MMSARLATLCDEASTNDRRAAVNFDFCLIRGRLCHFGTIEAGLIIARAWNGIRNGQAARMTNQA
jgi:hypothetical protein